MTMHNPGPIAIATSEPLIVASRGRSATINISDPVTDIIVKSVASGSIIVTDTRSTTRIDVFVYAAIASVLPPKELMLGV